MKATSLNVNSAEHSRLGMLWAAGNENGLKAFSFGVNKNQFTLIILHKLLVPSFNLRINQSSNTVAALALVQVQEYLSGDRQEFTVPIDWKQFTPFQADVYRAVTSVPYGQTRTYGQIAKIVGRPKAARAVGAANAANLLPIIIPCHRLIGADGSLHGYGGAGGLHTKQWLLDFEKENIA